MSTPQQWRKNSSVRGGECSLSNSISPSDEEQVWFTNACNPYSADMIEVRPWFPAAPRYTKGARLFGLLGGRAGSGGESRAHQIEDAADLDVKRR